MEKSDTGVVHVTPEQDTKYELFWIPFIFEDVIVNLETHDSLCFTTHNHVWFVDF